MRETIAHRKTRILIALRPVHRLQKKMLEGERLELFRPGVGLRIDELQFVAGKKHYFRASLWADADPVDSARRQFRAVGLDRDLELLRVESVDECRVHLQQRLAARA